MSECFLGEIRMFAGPYAPQDWQFCNGSLLSLSQNQALFSLLGTTFGGDGVTTFGVPDLRGRLPVGQGTGTGLTARVLGQTFGTETVTLSTANLPIHTHSLMATTSAATTNDPTTALLASTQGATVLTKPLNLYSANGTDALLNTNSISFTGGNSSGTQPHANIMPCMGINFIIALQGAYPQRAS